jgi:hypothetical protein
MPDPIRIFQALSLSMIAAAVALLLASWPWRAPHRVRMRCGGVLAVGVGIAAGCWRLGVSPNWPPREDQDRLLFVLLPTVIVVEIISAVIARPTWLPWLLRLLVAAAASPCLLYGSSYLSELAGAGSREWSPLQMVLILVGLAVLLTAMWSALWMLANRTACRSVPVVLAIVCGGAAVTIMLSGYASGGLIGLAIAAAIVGVVIGSLPSRTPEMSGILGLSVVGLFSVLVIGRFFGQLTTLNAALLGCAPGVAWIAEIGFLRSRPPRLRGITRLISCAIPVAIALLLAQRQFQLDASRPSAGSNESSADDYAAFGK